MTRTGTGWRSARRRAGAAASIVAMLLTGCTSHKSNTGVGGRTRRGPKAAWVGKLEGTDALVSLVADGLEVTAYVCDSKTISAWFSGPESGGSPALTGDGGSLTASLHDKTATGQFVDGSGRSFAFTANMSKQRVLWRAEGTVDEAPLLGGWIVSANGERRGSVSLGDTTFTAPDLSTSLSVPPPTVNITIDTGQRTTDVQASAIVPDLLSPATRNTTGFDEFVLVGLGDSYSAGNGNPAIGAGNTVGPSLVTPWDQIALIAPGASVLATLGTLFAPVLTFAINTILGAAPIAAAGARLFGQTSVPEIKQNGGTAQWGGPTPQPDETYRRLCHRGKSASEKVFDDLQGISRFQTQGIKFEYYNFACSGSQIRHLSSQAYGGDKGVGNTVVPGQIPPQLDQVRAWLSDQGTDGPLMTARTFITAKNVAPADVTVPHIDAAIMTAGGNDFGFSDVVTNCAVIPLPDCGDAELQRASKGIYNSVQSFADASANDQSTALQSDATFPGLNKATASYNGADTALRRLSVTRSGIAVPVTPSRVYLGEYPDPLKNGAGTLCNSTTGPLKNDTLGLASAVDAAFAENFLGLMDTTVDNAVNAHAAPKADGTGGWSVIPYRDAFAAGTVCTPAGTRMVNTGGDALKLTGNDLGVDIPLALKFHISSAVMHPNDLGYAAMKNKLEPLITKQVDDMIAAAPAKPARLRQVSASLNQNVGLRWDDKANNEVLYRLLQRPVGSTAAFTAIRVLGSDAQSFTVSTGGASTKEYEVEACTRFGKCTDSDPIIATDEAPVVPTGLKASRTTFLDHTTGVLVTWTPSPQNVGVHVVIRVQSGTSDKVGEFPVNAAGLDLPGSFTLNHPLDPNVATFVGTYTIRVRGCNILGCTATGAAVTLTIDPDVSLTTPTTSPLPTINVGPTLTTLR